MKGQAVCWSVAIERDIAHVGGQAFWAASNRSAVSCFGAWVEPTNGRNMRMTFARSNM